MEKLGVLRSTEVLRVGPIGRRVTLEVPVLHPLSTV